MAKKSNTGIKENQEAMKAYGIPPLLNETLIAQLQGAVNAAQRKRLHQSKQLPEQQNESTSDEA
jgi:hypothetical protein